jgi:hypothetical protein
MTGLALFFKAYWKPLCILALAIAAFSILEWWGHSKDQQGYRRAKAEAVAELQREREHWAEIKQEMDRERYEEKSALQDRVSKLLARGSPIRLCSSANQVRTPTSTGQPPGAGTDNGQAPGAGDDLRPRLVAYGASCEDLRQRLEDIQRWYHSP